MTIDQKIQQLAEELRHEEALRQLHGNRLDTHDAHLAAVNTTLDRVGERLDQITEKIDRTAEQQAKSEAMFQNLLELITKEHSNGKGKKPE